MPSRSKPGPKPASKSRVRIHVTKGSLHGYSLYDKRADRREVLKKLAKKDTWETVVKRLNALYIYNKNKHPQTASKFKRDMKFIQKEFSSKKMSKRHSKKKSKKRSTKKRSIKKRSTKKRSTKKLSTKKRSTKKRSASKKRSAPKKLTSSY
jgi:hypothetical protein